MHRNLFGILAVSALACGCLPAQTPSEDNDTAAPISVSNAFDSQEARAFQTSIRELLNTDSFAKLEAIAGTARSQKTRFRGGAWKLHAFYAVVQGPGSLTSSDDVWSAHFARLHAWMAAYPSSPTPQIALGRAYLRYAWKARGSGYSNTVTAKAWKQFRERIGQARSILEGAQSIAENDPHWFNSMQQVALAQGWTRPQMDQLLERAIAVAPNYYYFYIAHANYLLPRWHGKEGDAEAFTESIADRIGGDDGNMIYFHIAEAMDCCGAKDRLPGLSWERIKEGFSALESQFGSINFQRNVMAYLAVRNKDEEFAAPLFARIGDDWNRTVWGSKANFESRTVAPPDSAR